MTTALRYRCREIYLANLDPLRMLLIFIALQWAWVLISHPERSVAHWPVWSPLTWGYIWLVYAIAKAGHIIANYPLPLILATNVLGVFITSCWVSAYLTLGTWPPAPVSVMLASIWLLMRTKS